MRIATLVSASALILLTSIVASAKVPPGNSPPIWSHPRYTVHWANIEWGVDDASGLDDAWTDLVDNAGDVVGRCHDVFHGDFEEWTYIFYWPGTTDVAGSFHVAEARSDPHASSNGTLPGPSAALYHFVGEVTEAYGVFGEDGLDWVGARAEMRAEVTRDGGFGCTCKHTAPDLL